MTFRRRIHNYFIARSTPRAHDSDPSALAIMSKRRRSESPVDVENQISTRPAEERNLLSSSSPPSSMIIPTTTQNGTVTMPSPSQHQIPVNMAPAAHILQHNTSAAASEHHKPAMPAAATKPVHTDPENIMDNWLASSRESGKQKDSHDPYEKAAWDARKALDSVDIRQKSGMWVYNEHETERHWVEATSSYTEAEKAGYRKAFPAKKGQKEISRLYREHWLSNDKKGFLDALYKKYAHHGSIREKTIWEIFRCLVSELVPDADKRDAIPSYTIAEPNTIWHVGKCMLQIITNGRFWDENLNVLKPVDAGTEFGEFKKNTLQVKYSKNLLKYILGCLKSREDERYTRPQLLKHFEEVLSTPRGIYIPPVINDTAKEPYKQTKYKLLIPEGLTHQEGLVYEKLIQIAAARKDNPALLTPHIITITDLAKDYDDLMAMMCLKELHRLGLVHLEGFVANLIPAEKRALFGRGALNSLGLDEIPCAVGTVGDERRTHNEQSHEFKNAQAFMAPDAYTPHLPEGQQFLKQAFSKAVKENRKLTFLGISSLMDIETFAKTHGELLQKGLGNVVLQGGYRVINGNLTADPAAANNAFDMHSAIAFHKFLQEHKIHSTAWTKVATEAVVIYNTLFEFLDKTEHPLGPYIRKVQVNQDLNFYARACTDKPFAPHMTQDWYVHTKSTWFAAGHEPDEVYPLGEAMVPYFTKVIAYDALAAVGAAGEDVLDAFKIIKPLTTRPDAADPIHRLIGVPRVDKLPADHNIDGDEMGLVITALMKGSILAVKHGLKSSP